MEKDWALCGMIPCDPCMSSSCAFHHWCLSDAQLSMASPHDCVGKLRDHFIAGRSNIQAYILRFCVPECVKSVFRVRDVSDFSFHQWYSPCAKSLRRVFVRAWHQLCVRSPTKSPWRTRGGSLADVFYCGLRLHLCDRTWVVYDWVWPLLLAGSMSGSSARMVLMLKRLSVARQPCIAASTGNGFITAWGGEVLVKTDNNQVFSTTLLLFDNHIIFTDNLKKK